MRTGSAAKPNSKRVTTPYLTKYERARILGTRALQISCVPRALVCCLGPDAHAPGPHPG